MYVATALVKLVGSTNIIAGAVPADEGVGLGV